MGADRGTDNREQRVDRLTVERPELDRLFEEAERDHRPQDVHHDRIADVRHGDAVAQSRGTERLPRQQHLEQELAVNLLGQGHDLDQRLEHGKLVRPAEPIVDAACLEGFRQTDDGAAAVRLGKDVGRDVQALRSRPFEQFGPIEAVLLIDPIRRQPALLDPPVNRFFGYLEQLSGIADTQIHPRCSVAAVLAFGQMMTSDRA